MMTIIDQLQAQGIDYELLHHPRAMSAVGEAISLGLPPDEVVKTICVDTGDGDHVMCAIPAPRRLDMRMVKFALDDTHCHLASETEMQSDFPECELGAFAPIGHSGQFRLLVDPEVMDHSTVVFAAGTQTESVRCRSKDVFRGDNCQVTSLTRDPATETWIH